MPIPSQETIQSTAENLKGRNFQVEIVDTKQEAFELLKKSIPAGASLITGGSETLVQIGFSDYLKAGKHGWNNLKDAILAEKDPKKQGTLRKQLTLADYYIGSMNALSETGELVFASGTGSQIPSIAFNSDHVFLVVGAQKIVPTLEAALNRVREHVVPLEDKRQKNLGNAGTLLSKILIYEKRAATSPKTVTVILVKEELGY